MCWEVRDAVCGVGAHKGIPRPWRSFHARFPQGQIEGKQNELKEKEKIECNDNRQARADRDLHRDRLAKGFLSTATAMIVYF